MSLWKTIMGGPSRPPADQVCGPLDPVEDAVRQARVRAKAAQRYREQGDAMRQSPDAERRSLLPVVIGSLTLIVLGSTAGYLLGAVLARLSGT